MYNYHNLYTFSDKEIEQISDLAKRWSIGDTYRPVDSRRLTKQVKDWARNWNLLEVRNNRLYITGSFSAVPFQIYSLPIEAVWRLVRPMLREDGATGYSIVNNKLWMSNLGIAPQNNRFATDRELQEKEYILSLLASHQYIYFQMGGSVWSISIREGGYTLTA